MTNRLAIHWIDILNEEFYWTSSAHVAAWLKEWSQCAHDIPEGNVSDFEEALRCMREHLDALHFDEPLDLTWLNGRLAQARFEVKSEEGGLPPLHAKPLNDDGPSKVRALTDTLLLQFAAFLNDALKDPDQRPLSRCEGLYRADDAKSVSIIRSITDKSEARWRAEIALVCENDLYEKVEIQRCADVFITNKNAKFCSDACRSATFQIAKQYNDPQYLAEKQKRYRSKHNKKTLT